LQIKRPAFGERGGHHGEYAFVADVAWRNHVG
jgi:hypothetical protein